jgi:hypothetical protein
MLTLDDKASRNHGAQIVDDGIYEDFKHLHQHEGDEHPCGDEMQSPGGLAPADDVDPSGNDGIQSVGRVMSKASYSRARMIAD